MSKFQGHHQKNQLHLRRNKARSKYARQGKKSEPVTTLQNLPIKPMRGVNYCPTDLMRGPFVHPATQSSLFASSTFRHQIYVLLFSALVLQLIHSGDCQPERTGPEVFPSFTWASQLCATGSLTSPRYSKQQEAGQAEMKSLPLLPLKAVRLVLNIDFRNMRFL